MANLGGKDRTVICESSQGRRRGSKSDWRVFSGQTENGLQWSSGAMVTPPQVTLQGLFMSKRIKAKLRSAAPCGVASAAPGPPALSSLLPHAQPRAPQGRAHAWAQHLSARSSPGGSRLQAPALTPPPRSTTGRPHPLSSHRPAGIVQSRRSGSLSSLCLSLSEMMVIFIFLIFSPTTLQVLELRCESLLCLIQNL